MPKIFPQTTRSFHLAVSALSFLLPAASEARGAEAASPPLPSARRSFYHNPLSFGTTRDPDPPKYSRNAGSTGIGRLLHLDWLDVGLDYRIRYEYRADDLRRVQRSLDQPLLHRTRAYIGIHDLLDPFRFAFEMQDARREHSQFVRDNRDVNEFAVIRLYGELYFQSLLGRDALGARRPFSLRFGIHNFDFLDRRLLTDNHWRNTAGTFKGFLGSLGQEANDWQVDLLAVQPLNRQKYDWDSPVPQEWVYGVIGHWRRWSEVITLEPFYLALNQSAYAGVVDYQVHSPGLRAYGQAGGTGFDYDFSLIYQTGRNGTRTVQAYAGTFELGFTFASRPWKPRLSLFYGYASGDHNPSDNRDTRFQRFFGLSRAWSSNDYITFQNISTPTARLEIRPREKLRLDMNWSAYWLASATDVFSIGNVIQVQDKTGASGSFLGSEYNLRLRYARDARTDIAVGWSWFQSGGYVKSQLHRDHTCFAYFEISRRFF